MRPSSVRTARVDALPKTPAYWPGRRDWQYTPEPEVRIQQRHQPRNVNGSAIRRRTTAVLQEMTVEARLKPHPRIERATDDSLLYMHVYVRVCMLQYPGQRPSLSEDS